MCNIKKHSKRPWVRVVGTLGKEVVLEFVLEKALLTVILTTGSQSQKRECDTDCPQTGL